MNRITRALMIVAAAFFLLAAGAGHDHKKKDKDKKKKEAPPKTDCSPSRLDRTSNDSLILKKYVGLYKPLGGVCYILHLQHMGKLERTSDSTYSVKVSGEKDAETHRDWQTYLYCPIGKPNGTVALLTPDGRDTLQLCTYQNEKKEGVMFWVKGRDVILARVRFRNDEMVKPPPSPY